MAIYTTVREKLESIQKSKKESDIFPTLQMLFQTSKSLKYAVLRLIQNTKRSPVHHILQLFPVPLAGMPLSSLHDLKPFLHTF